jgi:hypothetical protein
MNRCTCGYILGEGYFTNCKSCIDHNGTKVLGRRGAIARSINSEDEFERPKQVKRALSSAAKVHAKASADVAKRQAINQHVKTATQMPAGEKARKFVASIAAAAPKVKERPQTKEEADGILSASGWRRCFTQEGSVVNDNLEHDEYEVLFSARDGNCLFHCFVATLVERGIWKESQGVFDMREIIAKCFTDNKHIVVGMATVDGQGLEIEFSCENIEAIRSVDSRSLTYDSSLFDFSKC